MSIRESLARYFPSKNPPPQAPVIPSELAGGVLEPDMSVVDLRALWEDPVDQSIMPMVFSGAAAALSLITLLVVMMKH